MHEMPDRGPQREEGEQGRHHVSRDHFAARRAIALAIAGKQRKDAGDGKERERDEEQPDGRQ